MASRLSGKYLNLMYLTSKLKNIAEPLLEPVARLIRFAACKVDIKKILKSNSAILDYGCGPEAKFLSYLADQKIEFKKYYGYDPLLRDEISTENALITRDSNKIEKQNYDLISMFAVLEHLPYPNFNFDPILNKLKVNGYLLITTPTMAAKPILEFLSFRLGMISRREIEEHTHYFDLIEIPNLFKKYSLQVVKAKRFELGLNNYVLLRKTLPIKNVKSVK